MNDSLMLLSEIGRILVDFLLLDLEDTEITYQDCLAFLTFMDYYVSKLSGSRELKRFVSSIRRRPYWIR